MDHTFFDCLKEPSIRWEQRLAAEVLRVEPMMIKAEVCDVMGGFLGTLEGGRRTIRWDGATVAHLLVLRFQGRFTLSELGRRYGVSRERIYQVLAKALRMLRHPSRKKLITPFYIGTLPDPIRRPFP